MPEFLTVAEASKLTGKSPSSIRRIIHPITKDDAHPDRALIQPSADEARERRVKAETFAWRISEELLRKAVRVETPPPNPAATMPPPLGTAEAELLAMLRRELDIKNEQIAQQGQTIASLSERLREGNLMIHGLQQRLTLTDGRMAAATKPAKDTDQTENNATEPVKTKRPASPAQEKGSKVAAKPAKPKKGLFSRFFGKRS